MDDTTKKLKMISRSIETYCYFKSLKDSGNFQAYYQLKHGGLRFIDQACEGIKNPILKRALNKISKKMLEDGLGDHLNVKDLNDV